MRPTAMFGFKGVEPGIRQRRRSIFSHQPANAIPPSANVNTAATCATRRLGRTGGVNPGRLTLSTQVAAFRPSASGFAVKLELKPRENLARLTRANRSEGHPLEP